MSQQSTTGEGSQRPDRLDLGEAFMFCRDCMVKLYSFDGDRDDQRPCPHPDKCEKEIQSDEK